MIKIISHTATVIKNTHEFYCDDCGKLIGSSLEFDDGYVTPHGAFTQKMFVGDDYLPIHDWYSMEATLCYDCACIRVNKIKEALGNLGFVPESEVDVC